MTPRRQFRIPRMRKANGHRLSRKKMSGPWPQDIWGCSVEPGKYFGRFQHAEAYFYVYGSWNGDCVSLHREHERDGHPVARVYLTPSKKWWTSPMVYGTEANGLKGLHDSFVSYAKSHPELKRLPS